MYSVHNSTFFNRTLIMLNYIVFAFSIYYATTTQTFAQEVGVVIDSVEVGFGNYDAGLGPARSRIGGYVWEIKENGEIGVKDTLDFGDLILYKRGDPNEYNIIYGGVQSLVVTGDGIDSAFTWAVGRILAPDGTPRVDAHVGLFDAYSPYSAWNHGDVLVNSYRDSDSSAYTGDGSIRTDTAGIFSQLLRLPVRKNVSIVSVEKDGRREIITNKFELSQNYPNPFNPTTTIKYSLPVVAHELPLQNVTLKIYNVLGKEVAILVNKSQKPGNYQVTFQAGNLPSGVYLYKLTAGNFTETKKMILLR